MHYQTFSVRLPDWPDALVVKVVAGDHATARGKVQRMYPAAVVIEDWVPPISPKVAPGAAPELARD